MKAPAEWLIRAAVVETPWAVPNVTRQYGTLLDAAINAGSDGEDFDRWIVLENGRMLNPWQVAALRSAIHEGSLALPAGLLDD